MIKPAVGGWRTRAGMVNPLGSTASSLPIGAEPQPHLPGTVFQEVLESNLS